MSEKERIRVDFNAIVRNTWNETYTTTGGLPLRLGKVVIDSIEAASGARGATIESDEKLRLANLASRIVNTKLDAVESAPFNVLILPKRIIDKLMGHVAAAAFVTGVYASVNKLMYGDEAKDLSFDDIEEVPDEPEIDTLPNVETVPCAEPERPKLDLPV